MPRHCYLRTRVDDTTRQNMSMGSNKASFLSFPFILILWFQKMAFKRQDKLKTSLMLILKFLEVKILQLYDTVHCSTIKVSRTDHITLASHVKYQVFLLFLAICIEKRVSHIS